MTGLTPYLHFPGTAGEALSFYADVFGGSAELHDFAEFGRTDGPTDAIAHGQLIDISTPVVASSSRRRRCYRRGWSPPRADRPTPGAPVRSLQDSRRL
jgi:uncharacterized glyoxalase superfamily protein PhnB